jgi:hypothetical protein
MTRNHRRRNIKPFPTFDKIQPIDPDEFNTTLNWCMNASIGKAIVENPSKRRLSIVDDDGKVSHIHFTDIPMNRILMAIQERYEDDTDKYFSVAMRIFELFSIMHKPEMAKWMRVDEEITEVHPAVTDVAATVMLNAEGKFPLDEFLAKVKELAETKYKYAE